MIKVKVRLAEFERLSRNLVLLIITVTPRLLAYFSGKCKRSLRYFLKEKLNTVLKARFFFAANICRHLVLCPFEASGCQIVSSKQVTKPKVAYNVSFFFLQNKRRPKFYLLETIFGIFFHCQFSSFLYINRLSVQLSTLGIILTSFLKREGKFSL